MPSVNTVTGPVDAGSLGIVLPHEHILADLSCLWQQPSDPNRADLVDAPISLRNRGRLQNDPYNSKTNMLLDNMELAIGELLEFKNYGGGTIVDLSSAKVGPYPQQLREIAKLTGLNIIAGCGYYTKRAHPEWIANASIDQIAERMIADITVGFEGTDIRAGIIGEIGSSNPIHPDEEKVLCAAALAQIGTQTAINVHLPIFGKQGHKVVDILERQNADLSRVVLSHLDEVLDHHYHVELAKRGVYVEFDCFGSEFHFDQDGEREPSDPERIDLLMKLIDAGFASRILISQDVCTKLHLLEYGGYGYAHILRTIVPRLKRIGLDDMLLEQILIANPAKLLGCGVTQASYQI